MSGLELRLHSPSPVPLDAQFSCAPGELVALVGPSGSGKSTLLRAIAGLHRGSRMQGAVRVGEQTWFDSAQGLALTPQQRRAGLVFQQYALFPHLSAIENIAIGAHSIWADGLKSSEILNKSQHWLQRFGLADLAHRKPRELSGGQQQRVALARALMRVRPESSPSHAHAVTRDSGVLLLDEPFSAVDAPMRQTLYRELAALHRDVPIPIILVTHDLQEARRLADRIVILDAGCTLQAGTPQEVINKPRNARVAQLVGIHNHFAGRFYRGAQGVGHLQWGELHLQVPDKGKIDDGTAVTWVIAGEWISLGAASEHVNALQATWKEILPLGEMSVCQLALRGTSDVLVLNLSTALLRERGARIGEAVTLSLPPQAVHIMPLRVS
jgi:molybdate transport system ATP-binding protein